MAITVATAAAVREDFDKYLADVQDSGEIIITKDGKPVARLLSHDKAVSFLAEQLAGILKNNYDDKEMYAERVAKHA